jgi:hypothetical protein
MQQRFGTLFQITSRMPALRADLARRILTGAARLALNIALDGWIGGADSMRSARNGLWTSFQTEIPD